MKVRKRTGRGRSAPVVERPVRVVQHCNDWATVDYLDEAGGHGTVPVTGLVMEHEADLAVFHPALTGHGQLWNEFKLKPEEGGTFVFVPLPREEVRRRRAYDAGRES